MSCRWGVGTERPAAVTPGQVRSSLSTSVRGRCPVPSPVELLASPLQVTVTLSDGENTVELQIALCEEVEPMREGITICTEPLFNANRLRQAFPTSLEEWVNHHSLIGVD